ncbi:hypothetical protein SEA_REYNAULD_72 [Rhodococcus phage Reynauld]|uniref:Uncharacterized protein n=1 Tax=Rhodococcus phage Reynauld TaxID=3062845 RepID=A0ACD4UHK6_9CAUD|nr:hypothetical protein SEA_REYNAULD_72 [Rhodococcus phage Reynauld]
MSDTAAKQYWHLFTSYDSALYASVVVGPSPYGPDESVPDAEDPKPIREIKIGPLLDDENRFATWVATFDHEPTTEDKDAYAPEGHRSWEKDEDGNLIFPDGDDA